MNQAAYTTLLLQEYGLPLFTTSIKSYQKQFNAALDKVSKVGRVIDIVERPIGRSVYHLAVVELYSDGKGPEATKAPLEPSDPETEAPKSRKSRSRKVA